MGAQDRVPAVIALASQARPRSALTVHPDPEPRLTRSVRYGDSPSNSPGPVRPIPRVGSGPGPGPGRSGVRRIGWIVATLTLLACGGEGGTVQEGLVVTDLHPLATPAAARSGEPNLAAGPDGVWLSWLERSGPDRHTLRLARWDGSGWSDPVTVIDRPDLFVNWADFPAVGVLGDGTLLVHWLERSGPGTYAYDVRARLSRDGGASWTGDIRPHRDGLEVEHGFVSIQPLGDRFGLTWLDGRRTVDGDPMTLRFATITPDGQVGDEALLDGSTCDCCQTDLAVTDLGPVAVYRDRTPDEIRDIRITRRVYGRWTAGEPVHRDGWVIAGCPVNGPAVAAEGRRVAVAWFTGAAVAGDARPGSVNEAGERGRVSVAFSDDAGAAFGSPIRVDDGDAMGRVDVALLADGSALVTWLERVEGGAEVRARRVTPEGPGPAIVVTGTAAARASGFPRSARLGDRVVFAWTEPGAGGVVRAAVARIPVPTAPHDPPGGAP
jgi:hypothetical protein